MATIIDRLVTVLAFEQDAESLKRAEKSIGSVRTKLDGLGRSYIGLGGKLTLAGGAVAGAFGATVKAAIDWETAFTGVQKTVNATEDELAALDARLREMARTEVPVSAGELAALAEAAGQLGIETAQIDDFVKVIAQLGTTTNLVAEEGAQQLARFANITSMAQGDFDRLGATIVDLGNNFATTEAEIVAMGMRLAGAGDLIGLSEAQILGISTALTSVGVNAEAGGTAFSRIMTDMQKAVQTGSEELDVFGQVIGRTGGEFAGMWELHGPEVAIQSFISGIQRMIADGENVHEVLEQIGFDSVRIRDSILRAAGAGDLFSEAMERGSTAWEENTALTREAELRYSTMASRLTFAKNRVMDLAVTVGGQLAPVIVDLVDRIEPLIGRITEWASRHPRLTRLLFAAALAVAGLGISLIGLGVALRVVAFAFGPLGFALRATAAIVGLLTSGTLILRMQLLLLSIQQRATAIATGIVTAAQWAWNVALTANPIGVVIMLIALFVAALAGLGYVIWRFREQIIGGLVAAWEWLGHAVGWVRERFLSLPAPIQALIAVLGGPIGAIVLLVAHFGKIRDAVGWVRDAFASIPGFVMDAVEFLSEIDLYDVGRAILQTLIDGVLSMVDAVRESVSGVLDGVRSLLPSSDAKEGPLSRLTASGQALVTTFQAGVDRAGPLIPEIGEDALPRLEGMADLAMLVRPHVDALPEMVARVAPDVAVLPDVVARVAPEVAALPDMVARVSPVVDTLPDLAARVSPVIQPLPDLATRVSPMVGTLPDLAARVSPIMQPLPDLAARVSPMVGTLSDRAARVAPVMQPLPDLAARVSPVVDTLPDLAARMAEPLPVAPAGIIPAGPAAASDGDAGRGDLTITIERMEIAVPGGDAHDVAAQVSDRLRDELRRVIDEWDNGVLA